MFGKKARQIKDLQTQLDIELSNSKAFESELADATETIKEIAAALVVPEGRSVTYRAWEVRGVLDELDEIRAEAVRKAEQKKLRPKKKVLKKR
jgi:hypothetical protein